MIISLSQQYYRSKIKSMKEEKQGEEIQDEQKLPPVLVGLPYISVGQKKAELAFYEILFGQSYSKENEMYFNKFLKNDFTQFPVKNGYPVIGKDCTKAFCYFFLDFTKVETYEMKYIKLLEGQCKSLKCYICKKIYSEPKQFIIDTALQGFLSLKLTEYQLKTLIQIQITKEKQISFVEDLVINKFQDRLLKCKLVELSTIVEKLEKQKKEDPRAARLKNKLVHVETYTIANEVQRIFESASFSGALSNSRKDQRISGMSGKVLPTLFIKQKDAMVVLYHQNRKENGFNSIAVQFQPPLELNQKFIETYDNDNYVYYGLTRSGALYKCDFKCMYNFNKNCYMFVQMAKLQGFDSLDKIKLEHCKIIVRNNFIYLFIGGRQKSMYLQVWKGHITCFNSPDTIIQMKKLLENKVRFREGYNCVRLSNGSLLKQDCLIFFGGMIEKRDLKFKLLDFILFDKDGKEGKQGKEDEEYYCFHKISLSTSQQFQKLTILYPSLAVINRNLVIWGGLSYFGVANKRFNRSIHFVTVEVGDSKSTIVSKDQVVLENREDNYDVFRPGFSSCNNESDEVCFARPNGKYGIACALSIKEDEFQDRYSCKFSKSEVKRL